MSERLPDTLLDRCCCNPATPLSMDPAHDFGLQKIQAHKQLQAIKQFLDEQQQLLWANRSQSVLVWLQGLDCSGKDGAIRHVFRGLNPQGVLVSNFRQPTLEERNDDFLARYRCRLPPPGRIGIFNRTPYEAVVSDLNDGFIGAEQIPRRLEQIARFEDEMSSRGILLLKVFLHISKAEQKERLRKRLLNPRKHWKLNNTDLPAHRRFDTLQTQWAGVLQQSQRHSAPWHVLPADHKWLRNLLLASLLARLFEQLNQQWPTAPLPFSEVELNRQ
jgi:PPK2 family polyphosphate:nucleotide phosphotransferase